MSADFVGWEYGHSVYWNGGPRHIYGDGTPVPKDPNRRRPCCRCGGVPTIDGHDPCIANLPGVAYACCGHGALSQAYVMFEDGECLRWEGIPLGDEIRALVECRLMIIGRLGASNL